NIAKRNDAGKGPSVNIVQSKKNDAGKSPSVNTVQSANGGSSPVIGEGSTDLSKSLSLNSVLIVPALEYNILSVSKITVALKCTVTFWP
ncbi:hypothetical protein Tco_0419817, partial [Tanacetum coccineum]